MITSIIVEDPNEIVYDPVYTIVRQIMHVRHTDLIFNRKKFSMNDSLYKKFDSRRLEIVEDLMTAGGWFAWNGKNLAPRIYRDIKNVVERKLREVYI